MSDLTGIYEQNRAFAETFDGSKLGITPNLSTVILTCMDARLDPARFAGLELGDAFVLRTAGARVTEAVATELSMAWMLLTMVNDAPPSLELMIVEHTGCGMERFTDPGVAAEVTARFGTSSVVETYAIASPAEALAADIERLRSHPAVPGELRVSGHLYDVTTGRLSTVIQTTELG